MTPFVYRARLMDMDNKHPVYDADTVWLEVELGFGHKHFEIYDCRLFGINAPELRGDEREAGLAARDYLRELLAEHEQFIIRTHKDKRRGDKKGKYGRYLVEILLPGHTITVNQMLIDAGHAIAATY